DRPVVVGPSMGGRIAIDAALAHPQLFCGLFLVAPGLSGWNPDPDPELKAAFERDERISAASATAYREGRLDDAIEGLRELWASALVGPALERFRRMVRENA